MSDIQKSVLGSVRLDSDVWEALRAMDCSLNQYLRESFFGVGLTPAIEKRIAAQAQPRKLSKKAAHIAALKASDPVATVLERDDIEHGNMELPSSGSIATVDVVANPVGSTQGKASVETWREGRKPLLKPKDKR